MQTQQLKSNQMNSLLNSNKKVVTQKNFTSFGNTKDYSSDSSSSESYKLPVLKKPKTVLDNKLKLDIFNKEAWSKRTFQENELLLHNELKYQIMLTNNIESNERFQNFFNQIEKLKQVDINEYIRSLEENFDSYKDELSDLIEAREMEERINKFLFNFHVDREKVIFNKKILSEKIKIKDNKFDVLMGKKFLKNNE